jgi:hypothetical protein
MWPTKDAPRLSHRSRCKAIDLALSRSPDLRFIGLELPSQETHPSGTIAALILALTVAGQWRILTALPIYQECFVLYAVDFGHVNSTNRESRKPAKLAGPNHPQMGIGVPHRGIGSHSISNHRKHQWN